mgnify:CR=1 FL=1
MVVKIEVDFSTKLVNGREEGGRKEGCVGLHGD